MAHCETIASDRSQTPTRIVGGHTSESDAGSPSASGEETILDESENTTTLPEIEGQSSSPVSTLPHSNQAKRSFAQAFAPGKEARPAVQNNALTLYRTYTSDGRVRDPTPTQFQSKPKGGNFMVVNFLLERNRNSEADAKKTSERTAAIAAAANAKRYSSSQRQATGGQRPPIPQPASASISSHSWTAPTPNASLQARAWQTWAPPPPQHHQQWAPGHTQEWSHLHAQRATRMQMPPSGHPPKHPIPQSYVAPASGAHDLSAYAQHFAAPGWPQSYAVTPQQPVPPYPLQGPHPSLSPHYTKVEQARLLTLLRSISPATVVDNLCKGLAYFGGIPGAPPPPNGHFPSSFQNGSGHQLISWLAELFPDGEQCPAYGKQKEYPAPIIPQLPLEEGAPRNFPSPDPASAANILPPPQTFTSSPLPGNSQAVTAPTSSQSLLKTPKKRGRPVGSKASVFRSDKGIKRGPMKRKPQGQANTSVQQELAHVAEASGQNPATSVRAPASLDAIQIKPDLTEDQPNLDATAPVDLASISLHPNTQGRGTDRPSQANNHKNKGASLSRQNSSSTASSPTRSRSVNLTVSRWASQRIAGLNPDPGPSSPALTNNGAPSIQTAHTGHAPPLGAVATNASAAQPQLSTASKHRPLHVPQSNSDNITSQASTGSRSPREAQAPVLQTPSQRGTGATTPVRPRPAETSDD